MDDLGVTGTVGVFELGHPCLVIVEPSSQPQPCCIAVGGQPDAGAVFYTTTPCPPCPLAEVRLMALDSLNALPCALSQGGSPWPRWIALSPHWVAVVCSSAEMTPHPQLHQSFHRWSESRCKMWLQAVPCAPVRGQLGQAGLGPKADRALTWTREREPEARRGASAVGGGVRGRGVRESWNSSTQAGQGAEENVQ